MNAEKLAKLQKSVRTGGKGSVRRKRKRNHRSSSGDDKRLQGALKKLGVQNIPGIEEVNMFMNDGTVMHFETPKVLANISANTYVVMGKGESTELQALLPGIIQQMGPESLSALKDIASKYTGGDDGEDGSDSDDDIPDLVDNFEAGSEQA